MAAAAQVGEGQLRGGRAAVTRAGARLARLITPGTVVALPTAPSIAPTIEDRGASSDEFRARCLRLTCIAGLGGLPQVSVPAGILDGCPLGISLIGWRGGDERLLDLALALAPHCGVIS
jgi:amidase